MNLHYTMKEMRQLADGYFKGVKRIGYLIFLESKHTGMQWVISSNRGLGRNLSIFYKWKMDIKYVRFSDFQGYGTLEEAIGAIKQYEGKKTDYIPSPRNLPVYMR